MIARTYISQNLASINVYFDRAKSQREALFLSKLAILELCGWIEDSMDDVIQRCANKHLNEKGNLKHVEKSIIKVTHGFDYDLHFRNMLIKLIG